MQSIEEARFHQTDFVRNHWTVILPANVAMDDVLRPEFWAHNAQKLKAMDHIEIYREDGTEWAELLVTLVERVAARVVMLHHVPLQKESVDAIDPEYIVSFAGPHHKWRVVRASDSEMVSKGHASREEANQWVAEYTKALAA